MPAWELTTLLLRIWVAGIILLVLVAMADALFRTPHSFSALIKRLGLSLIWPLALLTQPGRMRLFSRFKGTQGG
jgi:hypothetical protein